MKSYSIIWDGREKDIKEQINYLTKWARENYIAVKYWRDKTIQQRVCQYVGSPQKRDYWGSSYSQSLTKKYTILQMSDGQLEHFKKLVGKSFNWTSQEQHQYLAIDAFTLIKNAQQLAEDFVFNRTQQKFNTEKELKDSVEQTKLAKNQSRDWDSSDTRNGYKIYTETITTTHKTKFTPWVVLDDEGLAKVGTAITTTAEVDTAPLVAREKELIDIYNQNNIACGRIMRIPAGKEDMYSPDIVKAYRARETADRELAAVRKTLGAVKRKLTLASKRGNGIEYDMTPLSVI